MPVSRIISNGKLFEKSRSRLGKALCRAWVGEEPRSAEKSAQMGFCELFGITERCGTWRGTFACGKQKPPPPFWRKQDIVILRRTEVLPAALLVQVEDYFNQLSVELEDEAESQFRLGENGYIVLLEAGDNVRDLSNVGLKYVEMLDVGESLQAYKVVVLYDNDYLMTFFTQAGKHDEEVEQWLKDQAERN